MSPYTLWSIKLEKGDFNELKKYRDLIDIELYGYGQCVSRKVSICENNLEKYYWLDKSLSEVNLVDGKSLIETPHGSNYLELDYIEKPQ